MSHDGEHCSMVRSREAPKWTELHSRAEAKPRAVGLRHRSVQASHAAVLRSHLFQPYSNFIEMTQQLGRILIHSIGACPLKLLAPITAGEQTDRQRNSAPRCQ